jgi:hypothetical protein
MIRLIEPIQKTKEAELLKSKLEAVAKEDQVF